jgi:hypothetical protein
MIYAGTWFSLSVAIIAMYVTKVTPAGAFIRQARATALPRPARPGPAH